MEMTREEENRLRERLSLEAQINDLRSTLNKAKGKLQEQDEMLEKLSQPPLTLATVLSIDEAGDFVTIGTGRDGILKVFKPANIDLQIGDSVMVIPMTMQIIDKAEIGDIGDTSYVIRVIDEFTSEVEYQSSSKVVFNGRVKKPLDKGDKVVLDRTASVIIDNLGKDTTSFSLDTTFNPIEWEEIGGLKEAKQQMVEAVEMPYKFPDYYDFYRKKPPKGILLYGFPGCGKTMMGKAVATSIGKTFKAESTKGFIYVKAPEILDRYLGVSESIIRRLFQRAMDFKRQNGYPAVLFIDEADAILGRRGSGISSDIERTVVPMFLAEMDGMDESGALVMLVTNRPDTLDPAVVREGRVDIKIKIGRPDKEGVQEIFKINLNKVPMGDSCSVDELARKATEELLSPKHVIYQVQTKSNGCLDMNMCDLVSGSMVVNLVENASSIALNRDIANNKKVGLLPGDLMTAIGQKIKQSREVDHTDEINDFIEDFRKDVVGIRKGNP